MASREATTPCRPARSCPPPTFAAAAQEPRGFELFPGREMAVGQLLRGRPSKRRRPRKWTQLGSTRHAETQIDAHGLTLPLRYRDEGPLTSIRRAVTASSS